MIRLTDWIVYRRAGDSGVRTVFYGNLYRKQENLKAEKGFRMTV